MTRGVRGFVVGLGGAIMVLAGSSGAASAQGVSPGDQYSGRAYAVGFSGLSLLGVPINIANVGDTGPLPTGGGTVSYGPLAAASVPPLASVVLATEQATGSNGTSSATSTVSDVTVLPRTAPLATLIHATVLTASTAVACTGTQTLASTTKSSVASLSILGVPVAPALLAGVNTTVTVPGVASILINHRTYDAATNHAVAEALVITVGGALISPVIAGTITISHADSAVSCPPFAVTKTANGGSGATVTAGSDVTYGVTLTNQVNAACALTSVSDLLPPQPPAPGVPFTYGSGGPPGGTVSQSTSGGQNIVTWTFATPPSIPAGGTFSFTFVAHVPSNEPGGTYANVLRYVSTCGPGSAITSTNTFTSDGIALVTVPGGAPPGPPVPSAGAGLPVPTVAAGLGLLGAALLTGGLVDVVGLRRKRNAPPTK